MIAKNSEITAHDLGEGVARKILASGGGMMTVQFDFNEGSIGYLHTHPHEQVGYVVKGRFEITLGGAKDTIQTGDTYYVPPNVEHGVVALEKGVLLDVFTPQREDFLETVE
ncbi:MAG: cupin domain-containing protein [Gammaproteobacteria bacterium]|nr:cupin domain-containing protein [Gammaproteobacteria bacterium]